MRLARVSWTMPMSVLAMSTPPNRASLHRPRMSMGTNSTSSTRLNSVKVFDQMISA